MSENYKWLWPSRGKKISPPPINVSGGAHDSHLYTSLFGPMSDSLKRKLYYHRLYFPTASVAYARGYVNTNK
jgi:hypothetical protein